MNRRTFSTLGTTAAGMLLVPRLFANAEDDALKSTLLFDLVFERGTPNAVGSVGVNRVIVPVAGGTFEGPKLKGTIGSPSGDWIVARPDGSSLLDMRMILQTDDGQKIYMSWRGVAYTPPNEKLFARVLPMFETSATKYLWLNNVVAVGVYRPVGGKIGYRVYQIL
ncbi:MAG TPA: DUF3237 domain-containing protein [Vicinamibacterales bacterium]